MSRETKGRRESELNGWFLAALIVLAILLLLQVRIWVLAEYQAGGPRLLAGWGPIRVTLYPAKVKTEKDRLRQQKREARKAQKAQKKQKKLKEPQEELPEEKKNLGESLAMLQELLPIVLEAARRSKKKLSIDQLVIHLVWGAKDPAEAAISYGRAHAVLAGLLPILEANFKVKKKTVTIDLDYTLEKPSIYLKAALSMSVMQALSLGLFTGGKAFGVYRKHRKKKQQSDQTKEKAVR